MLEDDYLKLQAPKSTGREYFNMDWLTGHIVNAGITEDAQNIQTTLAEFTAISIANAVKHYAPDADVWLSGGGTANADLVGRIQAHCQGASVKTCNELGIPPEWIEAAAFAWLARTRVYERTVDTPSVTGASRPAVLGAIHYPAKA
jgi:anhydro-N-acetylmuramic acid kinase